MFDSILYTILQKRVGRNFKIGAHTREWRGAGILTNMAYTGMPLDREIGFWALCPEEGI